MKWIILVVISLIQLNRISCESNDFPISADCSSGVSDLCETLGSAENCKATEHCFQNVWSKEWQHVGKEKSCIMCHKMMDEVKSTLDVDGNGASAVVSLIDNSKVCSMAQLCTAENNVEQSETYVLAQKRKPVHKANKWLQRAPYCDLCHSIFNAVANFIDHHHNMLQSILKTLCGLFGKAFGSVCNKYAQTYGPLGVTIISSYLHNQICSSIHICAYHHANLNAFFHINEPKPISNIECDACDDAMALILNALSEENAVEDFKTFVSTECMKYDGYEAGCVELLHGQADTLHGLLVKNLSENNVCSANCLSNKIE